MLIEFNVRFGDPECQALMLRLTSDLLPVLRMAAAGDLSSVEMGWSEETAATVVMAAKGYPAEYQKGTVIRNLAEAEQTDGVTVFHAGTIHGRGGEVIAQGGRVLNVSATGRNAKEALSRAYEAIGKIDWPEGFCRRDIGWRSLKRE
jgi:phosphoribosylamine--glycine ligase